MAYLNLLASVPEPEVNYLHQNASFMTTPTLILGASHLLASWVHTQPLGNWLRRALDGGQPLHPDLRHPLRPPGYHPPSAVVELSQGIGDAWDAAARVSPTLPDDDWLALEVRRLLRVFRHASGAGECVVSALGPPADIERSSRVRLPWKSGILAQ